jgi:hypothetical protein
MEKLKGSCFTIRAKWGTHVNANKKRWIWETPPRREGIRILSLFLDKWNKIHTLNKFWTSTEMIAQLNPQKWIPATIILRVFKLLFLLILACFYRQSHDWLIKVNVNIPTQSWWSEESLSPLVLLWVFVSWASLLQCWVKQGHIEVHPNSPIRCSLATLIGASRAWFAMWLMVLSTLFVFVLILQIFTPINIFQGQLYKTHFIL